MGFSGNGINAPHLYTSNDAGAHWTNISANLPNAPANKIVVDPYTPNTVYVALDTGVYVTSAVSSCPTANCWSIYGTALPNAPVVDLQAAPAMPTGDGRIGMLRAATYGRGIWSVPLLNAIVAVAPSLSITPGSLNFAIQAVSSASSAQTLTLTNSGSTPLTISQTSTSGDFARTSSCTPAPLRPGASCTVSITFLPTSTGTRTGLLTVYSNAATSQTTVQLSGSGAPPAAVVLNPVFLSFPSTLVASTSTPQTLTVTNTGGFSTTLGAPAVSGDFNLANSTCGTTLAPGATCSLAATFAPTAPGTRTGTLTLPTGVTTLSAALSGAGSTPAALSLTPAQLTFPDTTIGSPSPPQTVILSNTGGLPAALQTPTLTGDYALGANGCGLSLAANSSCSISISFRPTSTGARPGTLTIPSTAAGQSTVPLSGTGVVPATIILTPTQLTFASTIVGAASPVQNITISNTGAAPATLSTPTVTGDFAITANTCAATLPPGTGCTVSLAFKPSTSGTRTGTFTVPASVGAQSATLSGSGTLPATDALSTTNLAFSPAQLNTASTPQTITLTNSGDLPLQLIAASVTAGDFTVTNTCGNSLNGHASCTLQFAFVPRSIGPQSGTVVLSDQYRTQTITLSGTGLAPPGVSLTPFATVSFAPTGVGASSTAQTLTLTNNGGVPLALQRFLITGDFAIAANTCGATLAPSSACTLQVVFSPSAPGLRTGTVSVTDNAAGSPQAVTLSGTAVDFALAPNGPTSITITAGQQAVFPLLLSSSADLSGSVSFTCSPIPAHATCFVNPTPAPLGGTTNIIVTVATSVTGAELHWPFNFHRDSVPGTRNALTALLAAVLPIGLTAARRRRFTAGTRRSLAGAATLWCLFLLVGCSASRIIPGSGSSPAGPDPTAPTPPAAYNLTVTGTNAGLTRAVTLTLIVQ